MVATLPRYGNWANSVREFPTPYGTIGYRQTSILWILHYHLLRANQISPTGIAAAQRVQPSVVTRALAKLEAARFIERSMDPDDARVVRIAITEQGRLVSEFVERLFVDDVQDSMADLDDADVGALRHAVETPVGIVEEPERKRQRRSARGAPTDG